MKTDLKEILLDIINKILHCSIPKKKFYLSEPLSRFEMEVSSNENNTHSQEGIQSWVKCVNTGF